MGNSLFLDREGRVRDRAPVDLANDSKVCGCDLVKIRVCDVVAGPKIRTRAIVVQQKDGTTQIVGDYRDVRACLLGRLERRGGSVEEGTTAIREFRKLTLTLGPPSQDPASSKRVLEQFEGRRAPPVGVV